MKSINILYVSVFVLLGVLYAEEMKKIKIVDNGKLQADASQKGWQEGDGYLHFEEGGSLQAGKAISGDEFKVNMKISLDDGDGHLLITVGDNEIGFTSKIDLEERFSLSREEIQNLKGKGKIAFLQGPSIGANLFLGLVNTYITPGKPFELSVHYKDGMLSYTIDNKSVYSEKALIAPAGQIKIAGYGEMDLRVYDIACEGKFQTLEALYTREYLLNRAQTSVDMAAEKVKNDPNRPAYHFQPPANWNNDPNGLFYYEGYYHMFYQHNPYGDVWEWMHWGHARSKDLVHWEHLPIAFWPSLEKGERHCFSGSGFIMDDGKPIIFYTSIGHENPEQWAAVPIDDELIHWEKHPANPILVMEDHDGQRINSWRDPFLFREAGKTYMVNGGHPRESTGSLMLYEAENTELTEWKYLGEAFTGDEKNWECPNFFKVDDKYVLIYSPHGRVEYYTGKFDVSTAKFTSDHHAAIDNGGDWNYYAPNTLQMEDGRRLLFGWIHRFKTGQGWQGAISLPRDLSIDNKGRLIQQPVAELTRLRGEAVKRSNIDISNAPAALDISTPQFEMIAEIDDEGTGHFGIRFNDENGAPFEILLSPEQFSFGDEVVPIAPVLDEKIKKVHLFFDHTVIELFINDGQTCATKVVYPDRDNLNFQIFSTDDNTTIESLNMWMLKSIW